MAEVKSSTVMAVALEMQLKEINRFTQDLVDRLKIENPLIIQWLSEMSKQEITPQKLVYVGVVVYRLLEKQQETNLILGSN